MADRILVALPDGRWLALDPAALTEALQAGAEIMPSASSPQVAAFEALVDAETAAAQLGVTARLLEDYTRAGIAPHYRVGRFVRYRPSELAAHFQVGGATPPTDSQSVTPFRRHAKQ